MANHLSHIVLSELNDLIVNMDHLGFLSRSGFTSFDFFWNFSKGTIEKAIKERKVIRIELNDQQNTRTFFLKRHSREFIGLKRLFFPRRNISQGRLEFQNICLFRKNGIPTVEPVAFGERFINLFWSESFLLTEDYIPYVSLEELILQDFFSADKPDFKSRKRRLLSEIGRLAKKMHVQGLNHLDFNATHILVKYEKGGNNPLLSLFDFQRISVRKFLRFRWKIKSLARVNQSLPDDIFDEDDRDLLFLSYLGKEKLSFYNRIQRLWINKKTMKIRRHTAKKLNMRKQTGGSDARN